MKRSSAIYKAQHQSLHSCSLTCAQHGDYCSQSHQLSSASRYIERLLVEHLHHSKQVVDQTTITPIQYDPDCPFKYNNFIYRLSLPTEISARQGEEHHISERPGCVPVPAGTKDFTLRLSNPDAADMHYETRIQNEVGMLTLASAALQHIKPSVVPQVFGWGAANREHLGWILEELMPGVPLAEHFNTMSFHQKKEIWRRLQNCLKGCRIIHILRVSRAGEA